MEVEKGVRIYPHDPVAFVLDDTIHEGDENIESSSPWSRAVCTKGSNK
jgi:hypothetical protein